MLRAEHPRLRPLPAHAPAPGGDAPAPGGDAAAPSALCFTPNVPHRATPHTSCRATLLYDVYAPGARLSRKAQQYPPVRVFGWFVFFATGCSALCKWWRLRCAPLPLVLRSACGRFALRQRLSCAPSPAASDCSSGLQNHSKASVASHSTATQASRHTACP
eukprot:315185-Chlamydomonas_euryale.AAC.1